MRYLTVALTKGRLANKTMEMFEKAGITCEEMKDKDSRKLIFVNEDLKMKFFRLMWSMEQRISESWVRIRSWRKAVNFMR